MSTASETIAASAASATATGAAKRVVNLWFIRHAESRANAASHAADKKHDGVHESDLVNTSLTEAGKKQAEKVHGPVDLLIVSPLRRTLETYVHSKLTVKRLVTSELVREYRAYGRPGEFEHETPANETPLQLYARVEQAVAFIKAQPETNIGILSHGVFLAELAKRLGKPLQTGLGNAQVVHLNQVVLG